MSFRAASGALGLLLLAACAAPESHAIVDGTPAVDGQISAADAAAFASICEPIIDPLPRPAWSRDQLEVTLVDGVKLSNQDIEQILDLAAEQGLTEPVKLWAGNLKSPGSDFQVWVYAAVEEGAGSTSRSQRVLCITNPEWEMKRSYAFEPKVGDWELVQENGAGDSPWREWTWSHVRDGDAIWDFDWSENATRETALDILQAIGEGNYLVDDGIELPKNCFKPWQGYLGTIYTRNDWRDAITPRPDPKDLEWEYLLELKTSEWEGAEVEFVQRNGIWIVVGVSTWIS